LWNPMAWPGSGTPSRIRCGCGRFHISSIVEFKWGESFIKQMRA
jgi:hypothetical protein